MSRCAFVLSTLAFSIMMFGASVSVFAQAEAPLRGMYELTLEADPGERNPFFDVEFQVRFYRPDLSQATVDGFYDGDSVYRARAYCDTPGQWRWRSISNLDALNGLEGEFTVTDSDLPGKLRIHQDDPRQFSYDNGEWFLHIGDTGYRYVTDTEPEWKAYIDQAARAGFTKIRTWFCRGRHDVQALFAENRDGMNIAYWQEIDRRIAYAFENHPHVMVQLIPYGEDTPEIDRYDKGDLASIYVAQYAQARFSACPNITWCISNDRHIAARAPLGRRDASPHAINRIGMDMMNREAWGTLITNHQSRFSGYDFVDAPWSDIITIEDMDQTDGGVILQYRRLGDDPVINDEDRYEIYRPPEHPRYFFRRLMWASLLSGGMATYGGLKTYEAYDGELRGVQGYYDAIKAGKLIGGADDFIHIHKFFDDTSLSLAGMVPCDEIAGYDPQRLKCIRSDSQIIVYAAQPDDPRPEKADVIDAPAEFQLHLLPGRYELKWFEPDSGRWHEADELSGGYVRDLKAPFNGDAILLLTLR